MKMFARSVPLTLTLALGLACQAREQLDFLDPDNEASGASCTATPTVLGLDEVSALGFSGADVLASSLGSHEAPLFWHEPVQDGPIDYSYGPESGESTIALTIAHEGGEVRFMNAEPAPSEDEIDVDCPDYLEIDVLAEIETGGGALAEALPVTLRAHTDLLAQVELELDLDQLDGQFSVVSNNPELEIAGTTLSLSVSSFGLSGSLAGMLEMVDDEVAGVGFVEYASFPSAEPSCGGTELSIPFETALAGFSAADALALLGGEWNFVFGWQGEAPAAATLGFVHDGQEVCAQLDAGAGTLGSLRFGAELAFASEGVQLSLPVEVSAEPNEMGGLAIVHVRSGGAFSSMVDTANFASTYGSVDVDFSGYDRAAIDFSGSFVDNSAPGSADGSLTIFGGIDPECSEEPGAPCEGVTLDELAFGEWANN